MADQYEAGRTAYICGGHHNEALADYTTAIEFDPDDAGHWRRRTGNRRWPA